MLARSRLGRLRNHIGRGRAVLPHPHIERTAEAERKAPFGLIELHGRHADVHDDAIDRGQSLCTANIRQIGEAVFHQGQSAIGLVDQVKPTGNRRPVAIDRNHPRPRNAREWHGCNHPPRKSRRHRPRHHGARGNPQLRGPAPERGERAHDRQPCQSPSRRNGAACHPGATKRSPTSRPNNPRLARWLAQIILNAEVLAITRRKFEVPHGILWPAMRFCAPKKLQPPQMPDATLQSSSSGSYR